MTTLILSAAQRTTRQGSKSFEDIMEDGVGYAYAFGKGERAKLAPGDKVVIVRKDSSPPKRAEGRLVSLTCNTTEPAPLNNTIRYDIRIADLGEVPFKTEPLNRRGIWVRE